MAPKPKPLILIVDDDRSLVDVVVAVLSDHGFQTKAAYNAFQARGLFARVDPDLLILDRILPDGDGLDLCRELREDPRRRNLPVLFLTSRVSVTERVTGLEVGADDYLAKPFAAEELVARARALLRRVSPPEPAPAALKSGDIELDLESLKATLRGKPLDLRPKELDLLQAFLENCGRVLTREFLLERVWGYERGLEVNTRVVDLTVSNLRGKLGASGKRLTGVLYRGYRLEPPD